MLPAFSEVCSGYLGLVPDPSLFGLGKKAAVQNN
jgi:hypothetical protein